MVHKKSEYELQFHKITNDIRAQIWKENVMFRETQKRMNLSDHYWRYQLIDDPCDCEEGSDRNVVIRSLRDSLVPNGTDKPLVLFQDKAVQTVEWKNENEVFLSSEKGKVNEAVENNSPPAVKESEVIAESFTTKKDSSSQQYATPAYDTMSKQQSGFLNEGGYISKENCPNLLRDKVTLAHTETPQRSVVQSHFNPSPTRNALRSYQCEPSVNPIFAAFGWNESDRDVGDQKTYNIRAPVDQVHHSALLASGKRLKELEQHLAEQRKKKQLQKSQLAIGPVNLSSIWMTEYQENFSRGQREPLARRLYKQPIVWRCS